MNANGRLKHLDEYNAPRTLRFLPQENRSAVLKGKVLSWNRRPLHGCPLILWILVKNGKVDTCIKDPGKDVDIWLISDLRTMIAVWMGEKPYSKAIKEKKLTLSGPAALSRNVTSCLNNSVFEYVPPAKEI